MACRGDQHRSSWHCVCGLVGHEVICSDNRYRDGTVGDFQTPATWPAELTKPWTVEVGRGHSAPVVFGDRILQFTRMHGYETVACFDLNGELVWRRQYAAPYKVNSDARGHGKGPKSSPYVVGDRVITLGISGISIHDDLEVLVSCDGFLSLFGPPPALVLDPGRTDQPVTVFVDERVEFVAGEELPALKYKIMRSAYSRDGNQLACSGRDETRLIGVRAAGVSAMH